MVNNVNYSIYIRQRTENWGESLAFGTQQDSADLWKQFQVMRWEGKTDGRTNGDREWSLHTLTCNEKQVPALGGDWMQGSDTFQHYDLQCLQL